MKHLIRFVIAWLLLTMPFSVYSQELDDDIVKLLHARVCERMDSLNSVLMPILGLSNDKNVIYNIVVPESGLLYPQQGHYTPTIYNFFCCRKIDDNNVMCYRIVFDYNYDWSVNNTCDLSVGASEAIRQIDSVVVNDKQLMKINRRMAHLLKHEPFKEYDKSIFCLMTYARIYTCNGSRLYSYSSVNTTDSPQYLGVKKLDDFISIVRRQFVDISIKQVTQPSTDEEHGLIFPYIDASDDGCYQPNYSIAYLDVVKTCKRLFRTHQPYKYAKLHTDQSFSFFNKLLNAVSNVGVKLDNDYDIRYICYIHNGDLYSIATIKGNHLHRVLVKVHTDGNVFIKANIETNMVINERQQENDINKLASSVCQSIYCYSLDEPQSLIEVRNMHNSITSIIGTAYCSIQGVGTDIISLLDRLDFIVGHCSGTSEVLIPRHPIIKKTPLLNKKRIIGYEIYRQDHYEPIDLNGFLK